MAKKIKGLLLGAVVGTLMGSISALFLPQQKHLTKKFKKQAQDLLDKAKIVGENVMDLDHWTTPRSNVSKTNFAAGATLGLLVGIGSALLLAPKTGKQLRKDLSETYQDMAEKTTEIVESFHLNNHNHRPRPKHHETKHHAKKAKARILTRTKSR